MSKSLEDIFAEGLRIMSERSYALTKGNRKYFTGKPCPKGHVSDRYTKSGRCVICCKEDGSVSNNRNKIKRAHENKRKLEQVERELSTHVLAHLPRTRRVAVLEESRFYFTGKPCKRGHVDKRYTSTRDCYTCERGKSGVDEELERLNNDLSDLPATRHDAISLNSTYYFTGKPCKHGHVDRRLTSSSDCVSCINIRSSRWRKANKAEHYKMTREWAINNPYKVRSVKHKRRTIIKSGDPHSVVASWVQSQQKICHWCGVDCESDFHVDHVIPLAKNGSHTIDNLAISCPSCNARKGAKLPEVFIEEMRHEK